MPRGERPLGPEDTALLRFAGDLRRLRDQVGKPSYRELAGRANYSPTALSDAAGGRKLPSLALTLAFVRACEGDPKEWTARWRELAAEQVSPLQPSAPYVGAAPFHEKDAKRYFGREALVERVLARSGSFTAVVGPSGSGRTSLLEAGLLPAFDHAVVVTPSDRPLDTLATALAGLFGTTAEQLAAELAADPDHLRLRVRQHCPGLVLLVDDFEKAFEATGFVTALLSCPRVVVAVRSDFRRRCHAHPGLARVLPGNEVLIEPMTAEELRRAVTEPAGQLGVSVETALVARLVADVAAQPALPFVSQALIETWRRKRGMTLSLAGYEESGGIEHVMAQAAETFFSALDEADQRAVRTVFLRLVSMQRNGVLQRKTSKPDVEPRLLDLLVRTRLVVLGEDGAGLAHDAVLRWPRLRGWIDEEHENLRTHQQLVTAIELWESSDRDPGALYRGARLRKARGLGDFLTAPERRFVELSARRETRRSVALISVAAVLAALVPGSVIYALTNEQRITQLTDEAFGRQAMAESTSLMEQGKPFADKFALVGYRVAPSQDAERILRLANAWTRRIGFTGTPAENAKVLTGPRGELAAVRDGDGTDRMWRIDETDPVPGERFPAGHQVTHLAERRAITQDPGGRQYLWSVTDHTRMSLLYRLPAGFRAQDLSADGSRVVGYHDDSDPGLLNPNTRGRAILLDLADGRAPEEIQMPVRSPDGVGLSRDGRELATALHDRAGGTTTISQWRIGATLEPAAQPLVRPGLVNRLTYSPDGRWLAGEHTPESTVEVWQLVPGGTPVPTATLSTTVPSGAWVTFGTDDRIAVVRAQTFEVYRLYPGGRQPDRLASVTGHGGSVYATYRPAHDDFLVRSGGTDPQLLTYELDAGRIRREMCAEGRARLTDSEWVKSFGEAERVEVC
ncbi:nSTAND1 domain-containing NTPase [Lentzea chajnantorensis]